MTKRNYNIDCLRFILILFVVQFHMNPYVGALEPYALFNVKLIVWMFMIVSLYLLQTRGAMLREIKWSRLLLPYLSWSIIYLCLRTAKHLLQGDGFSLHCWTAKAFLTGGAAVQLYFIPLLLFYQLIGCSVSGLFRTGLNSGRLGVYCGILIAFFTISSQLGLKSTIIGGKCGLFFDALFACICTQALVALSPRSSGKFGLLHILMLSFSAMILWWQASVDLQVYAKVLVASGIFYVIIQMPSIAIINRFGWLYPTSFGIFLSHHAIIEVFEILSLRLGFEFLPYNLIERALGTVLIVLISYGMVHTIRRSKYLSLLLIGEKRT